MLKSYDRSWNSSLSITRRLSQSLGFFECMCRRVKYLMKSHLESGSKEGGQGSSVLGASWQGPLRPIPAGASTQNHWRHTHAWLR